MFLGIIWNAMTAAHRAAKLPDGYSTCGALLLRFELRRCGHRARLEFLFGEVLDVGRDAPAMAEGIHDGAVAVPPELICRSLDLAGALGHGLRACTASTSVT